MMDSVSNQAACDHPLDGHTSHGPWCEPEPWDSARYMAPDPALSLEDQLKWYRVSHHILLLNVSERCRRKAAAAADREVAKTSVNAA